MGVRVRVGVVVVVGVRVGEIVAVGLGERKMEGERVTHTIHRDSHTHSYKMEVEVEVKMEVNVKDVE